MYKIGNPEIELSTEYRIRDIYGIAYAVHCTVYIMRCTVYTVRCTMWVTANIIQNDRTGREIGNVINHRNIKLLPVESMETKLYDVQVITTTRDGSEIICTRQGGCPAGPTMQGLHCTASFRPDTVDSKLQCLYLPAFLRGGHLCLCLICIYLRYKHVY